MKLALTAFLGPLAVSSSWRRHTHMLRHTHLAGAHGVRTPELCSQLSLGTAVRAGLSKARRAGEGAAHLSSRAAEK